MASPTFNDEYQTVAERIKIFREKFPEGSLRPADPEHPFRLLTIGDQHYVVVTAAAYRTPEDKAPGVGQAWEIIPGTTEYTRGSELMNAESSAWGRAIIAALAADSKKIASADEVRSAQSRRAQGPHAAPAPGPQSVQPTPTAAPAPAQPVQPVQAASQPVQTIPQPPQPTVAPDAHDPSDDANNRSLIDSIVNNVIKYPDSTVEDLVEAWTVLTQARLTAWRVDPFGGIDPDSDGKVPIGSLVRHIGQIKRAQSQQTAPTAS